jgi:hypothetical protein
MRGKLIAAVVALTVLSGLSGSGAHAALSGEPSATPLRSGNPAQFANPPFTNATADAADPWGIGWNPAKSGPEQMPPLQGQVDALFRSGDWVYVGGTFHRALRPDGSYDESVRHLVRVRWDTGRLDTAWLPDLAGGGAYGSGTVWNFAAFDPGDGVTRLVVAGDFTRIGTNQANARYLALFKLNDPDPPVLDTTLLSTADVALDDRVHAVAHELDGGDHVLYLGGYFTAVGTPAGRRSRSHLAKLRLTGNRFVLDDQWTPSLETSQGHDPDREWVSRIIPVPGADRILVGGFWTSIDHRGPTQEKYLAAVCRFAGTIRPWADPINKTPAGSLRWSTTKQSSKFPLFDMVLADEGGTPFLYTAQGGTNLAAKWDALTGARLWYWWSNGGVQAVTVLNGSVYFGFHGNLVSPVAGGLKQGFLTVKREGLWSVSPDGRTLSPFAPSFRPPTPSTEAARKIWALLGDGNLYAGGDFTTVAGAPLAKFAVFPVS